MKWHLIHNRLVLIAGDKLRWSGRKFKGLSQIFLDAYQLIQT
jgi:hypothetical protein